VAMAEDHRCVAAQFQDLLDAIRNADDPAAVSLAGAGLASHLHRNLKCAPANTADVLSSCIAGLGESAVKESRSLQGTERDAISSLLVSLLELVLARAEDAEHVRSLLLAQKSIEGPTLLGTFLAVLSGPGARCLYFSNNRPSRVMHRELPCVEPPGVSNSSGGAAFVHACQLLAALAREDRELAKVLACAHVLDILGGRLLHHLGSDGRGPASEPEDVGTSWLPFATAAVGLVDALVTIEEEDRLQLANPSLFRAGWVRYERADELVDAVVAALYRSLQHEGGSLVAQQLHLSGLRALQYIASHSENQAHRILSSNGLSLGVKVLGIVGTDEEAALVALRFLSAVAAMCPLSHRCLGEHGAAEAAERTMARYPRSPTVELEAKRVLQACLA